jgi:hypothetical protein
MGCKECATTPVSDSYGLPKAVPKPGRKASNDTTAVDHLECTFGLKKVDIDQPNCLALLYLFIQSRLSL